MHERTAIPGRHGSAVIPSEVRADVNDGIRLLTRAARRLGGGVEPVRASGRLGRSAHPGTIPGCPGSFRPECKEGPQSLWPLGHSCPGWQGLQSACETPPRNRSPAEPDFREGRVIAAGGRIPAFSAECTDEHFANNRAENSLFGRLSPNCANRILLPYYRLVNRKTAEDAHGYSPRECSEGLLVLDPVGPPGGIPGA